MKKNPRSTKPLFSVRRIENPETKRIKGNENSKTKFLILNFLKIFLIQKIEANKTNISANT